MFGLGAFEIVLVASIAVMIYGKRLPEVGRTVGKTMGDLRKQWQTISRDFELAANLDATGRDGQRAACYDLESR